MNLYSLLGRGNRCSSFTKLSDWLRGPPILLSDGFWRLFQRCRAGHLPQQSAKLKNTWIWTSSPLARFDVMMN